MCIIEENDIPLACPLQKLLQPSRMIALFVCVQTSDVARPKNSFAGGFSAPGIGWHLCIRSVHEERTVRHSAREEGGGMGRTWSRAAYCYFDEMCSHARHG